MTVTNETSDLAALYRDLRDTLGPDHPDTLAAFNARADELLLQETANPERGLWWLSFCEAWVKMPLEGWPWGPPFLGAVVVDANGFMSAITIATEMGLNPGGQVQGTGPIEPELIAPEYRNRLLTADEIQAMPDPRTENDGP